MFHIILLCPQIPHNTGSIGRVCVATNSILHLIKPLGFSLSDKNIQKAGLDYWNKVSLNTWDSLEDCFNALDNKKANTYFFSKKVSKKYWEANYLPNDRLVFGSEIRGIPESFLTQNLSTSLCIPMIPNTTRSLNLATSVSIALYHAISQNRGEFLSLT